MRDKYNYRVPGCSWIEIAGENHTFITVNIYGIMGIMFGLQEDKSFSRVSIFDCDLDAGCIWV